MLEAAMTGSRRYWTWISFLLVIIAIGFISWLRELHLGSGMTTGLSRDVTWGLHVGQLTFFVGVAASAVMVTLPYYLHDYKAFGKVTILGEFLAVSAVIISMLSVFAIMGQPTRIWNVLLHPTPHSIIFWDLIVLSVYLSLNILCGWTVLGAERKGVPPRAWIKPFILFAIIWAPLIHTVTAFIFAGLPGRHHWLTSLQAAHFLSTAFAAGPSLLIILSIVMKKVSRFDPGSIAIQTLAKIATYALIIHIFFIGLEFFTAFYSGIPGSMRPLEYLYTGLEGHSELVFVMWTSSMLAAVALVLLLIPNSRKNEKTLLMAALAVFFSIWLDKGFCFVVSGFIPNPFERVTGYWPALNEFFVAAGCWGIGFLVLTILYKIVIAVREESAV
ncbi:MAG TPA: NrfD/PsrC family molybdoenzyme membrane anchor subunit [Nitrospirota bacterium]|nr:NrfD/PsrC family molybdoenzyme membrane anchor subunit [Nitrospirota bacterium]